MHSSIRDRRSDRRRTGRERRKAEGEGCQTCSANYCIQSGEVAADDTNNVVQMMDAVAVIMSAK